MAENVSLNPLQHFKRIRGDVDVAPYLAELRESSDWWLVDTSRQRNVRCQRNTQNIFLRAAMKPLPPGARNANDVHEIRIMRAARLFPRTLEFCERVADETEGTLGRVTLVALLPRSKVYPHVDGGAYYRIRDRYHLILKSAGGSLLCAAREAVVMQEGELWAFDNKQRHWAENPSDELRVHVIFDVLPAPGRGLYSYPLES